MTFYGPLKAQDVNDPELERIVESILEEADKNVDYTELVNTLNQYYKRPLSLNKATREKLLSMHFLNISEVNEILAYRDRYGDFVTLYELQAIESLDQQTLRWLLQFVTIRRDEEEVSLSLENIWKYGDHDLFIRSSRNLEKTEGQQRRDTSNRATNTGYLGSPYRLYTRYTYEYSDNLSLGFTADKDPGEEFFRGAHQDGYDFYSAHFYLSDIGFIKSLAIGDYHAQFGEGLVMWSGLSFGKTPDVMNIYKNGRGLRPYRSSNENQFLRGAGVTFQFGDAEVTGFYSDKPKNANINQADSTSSFDQFFTSFDNTGYHRTKTDLKDKNAIRETIIGGNVKYTFGKLELGATGVHAEYDVPKINENRLYKKFDFSGRSFWDVGVNYAWSYENIFTFGEAGYSHNGAIAYMQGVMANLGSGVNLGAIYRNYPKDYQAVYANAFSEAGGVDNERGLFLGMTLSPFQDWNINLYMDQFDFPWLRFRADVPSDGYEYLADVTYTPSRWFETYWRYKAQIKDRNLAGGESSMSSLTRYQRHNLRWNASYRTSGLFSFQSRIAYSHYNSELEANQNGVLLFQDVEYESRNDQFSLTARYGVFDIDGFQSRIYTYENDLLYAFSIPFFSDKGMRYYLLAKWEPARYLDFWLKIGQTNYRNREEVGSALNTIPGNKRTEVKAQIRLNF